MTTSSLLFSFSVAPISSILTTIVIYSGHPVAFLELFGSSLEYDSFLNSLFSPSCTHLNHLVQRHYTSLSSGRLFFVFLEVFWLSFMCESFLGTLSRSCRGECRWNELKASGLLLVQDRLVLRFLFSLILTSIFFFIWGHCVSFLPPNTLSNLYFFFFALAFIYLFRDVMLTISRDLLLSPGILSLTCTRLYNACSRATFIKGAISFTSLLGPLWIPLFFLSAPPLQHSSTDIIFSSLPGPSSHFIRLLQLEFSGDYIPSSKPYPHLCPPLQIWLKGLKMFFCSGTSLVAPAVATVVQVA